MSLQMADMSTKSLMGIAKNVLVKAYKLPFPIDFDVMDIKEDPDIHVILGRPFMNTSRMLIDIDEGIM